MARSVKVVLEADVGGFTVPIIGAREETEALDNKVEALNRDLDKTAPASAKAAASMKLLGVESGKTKLALDDGLGKTSTSLGVLDQKLVAARAEVRRLADEFNRTGDIGTLDKLFDANKAVKDLERLGKVLTTNLAKDVQQGVSEGGKEGWKSVFSSLQGFLSTPYVGPVIAGVLAVVVTQALPMIGAALTAGGGLGLIAAGIAAQFRSAQIKDAAGGLASALKAMFTDATASFRAPVESALLDLTRFVRELDLKSVFQPLAQFVGPIEQGLQGFLSRVVGGLGMFSENLKPLIDVFVMHLPQFGAVLSSFLQRISRNAGENASAFDLLLTILESCVRVVGELIEVFDHVYKVAVNVALGIAIAFDDAFKHVPILGKQLDKNVDTLSRLAAEANGGKGSLDNMDTAASGLSGTLGPNGLQGSALGAAGAIQQLDQATFQWNNDALAAKNASLGFKDALANLKDQMANNKAGFDENSAAGRQNTEALNDLAEKAQSVADAVYASTGNSQAAAQAYKQARDQVLQLAIQGHATTSEIAALNAALDNAIKLRKGSVEIEVSITGSGKALVNNQGTLILSGSGRNKAQRWGGIYQHAEEGLLSAGIYPTMSPARYAFAEPATGGEAFVPRLGDYGRSTAILDQAARWYGGRFMPSAMSSSSVINVNVYAGIGTDGRAVGAQVAEVLRPYIHGSFGGDVQSALGRR